MSFDTKSARATLRLAIVVLVFGALVGIWEVFATQAPGSPIFIATLPGPVQSLRELAFTLGFLSMAAGAVMPRLAQAPGADEPVILVTLLHIGVLLSLGAGFYGATHGMHGEQVLDLRPDAIPLFAAKHGGYLLVGASLITLAARVVRTE